MELFFLQILSPKNEGDEKRKKKIMDLDDIQLEIIIILIIYDE